MADSSLWWLLVVALVGAELFTGSFYLLMLALGAACGALVAHLGGSSSAQMTVAALCGFGAVLALHFVRRRRPQDPSARAERSVNLDVGAIIQIPEWSADGTAQVRYRGAQWTAELRGSGAATPGAHRVVELSGSHLIVERV